MGNEVVYPVALKGFITISSKLENVAKNLDLLVRNGFNPYNQSFLYCLKLNSKTSTSKFCYLQNFLQLINTYILNHN